MISVILLAAGTGSRVGNVVPKQFLNIAGKPLILHTLDRLNKMKTIDQVIICCEFQYREKIEKMIQNHCPGLPFELVEGGETRQVSVSNGLAACRNDSVLIHEAARPFVKQQEFEKMIEEKEENVIYGLEIPFTVLKGKDKVQGVLNRDELINVQLPQKFNVKQLQIAFEQALKDNKTFTEDASLFYTYHPNIDIKVLKGSEYNIKVTYPIDFLIGETIYKEYILGQEAY